MGCAAQLAHFLLIAKAFVNQQLTAARSWLNYGVSNPLTKIEGGEQAKLVLSIFVFVLLNGGVKAR